eukprot:m.33516 g.33516  ORF g.33516 m.33516 type:complete len:61 (-) comp5123_c0_seq1:42-224(-)
MERHMRWTCSMHGENETSRAPCCRQQTTIKTVHVHWNTISTLPSIIILIIIIVYFFIVCT